MVLGTGFTPSTDDLIPEFVTAGFADLPMPANAQLLAYGRAARRWCSTRYQPEQHGWLRLAGPRWRPLLDSCPGSAPTGSTCRAPAPGSARLVGRIGDQEYEAVADPPDEFRVRALTRAARYPVSTLSRRAEQALWRGAPCWVLQRDESWARLRLSARTPTPSPRPVPAATNAASTRRGPRWASSPTTTSPTSPTSSEAGQLTR